MKWNQGTASTERSTLKISGANYFFDLCLWSQTFLLKLMQQVLPTPLFCVLQKTPRGRAQWAGSLYQGWQGSDRTGWKQEGSPGALCLESAFPGWLASKSFNIFYLMTWYMWHKMCFLRSCEDVWRSAPLNCCSPSTLHSPCFSAPWWGASQPRLQAGARTCPSAAPVPRTYAWLPRLQPTRLTHPWRWA